MKIIMNKLKKALLCVAIAFGLVNVTAHAQITATELGQQLEDKKQEAEYLEKEIGFAKLRRQASQDKLKAYENDLAQKQKELKQAQERYTSAPTPENEQFLRNAEQRIELADLSIKSRISSVVRLEAKEEELVSKLGALKSELAKLNSSVNKTRQAQNTEQNTQNLKSEVLAREELLQRRLETLQRENDRLRQVALNETEKREQAEERATSAIERAQTAELALAQAKGTSTKVAAEDVMAEDDTQSARARAKAEMQRMQAKLASGGAGGSSGVNLFLRGADGTDYGMFKYLGAQQYRADAVIHQASSRFRVAGRTYQVKVSKAGLGQEFVFLYDMSNPESPRFVTFKKSLLD